MVIAIEEFKASLPQCEESLLDEYIKACQGEKEARKQKSFESLKAQFNQYSSEQRQELLAYLSDTPTPESSEKKVRVKKSPLPHGYKPFEQDGVTYYVVPYFNLQSQEISRGAQATWLKSVSKEQKEEQFSTLHLLSTKQISLADLAASSPEAVKILVDGAVQTVTPNQL